MSFASQTIAAMGAMPVGLSRTRRRARVERSLQRTPYSCIGTLLLYGLLAMSCGGSNSTPTQPTWWRRTQIASIAVTLPSVLKVAETAQGTAVATLNNGDAKPLSTGWRSDTPAVATVTNAGLVTGVANGRATIYITSDAVQGTKSLRVVPNYHGQWTGSYRIDRCTPFPTQAYNAFCSGYSPGTAISLSMTFTQNGEVVNGQFIAGGLVSTGFVSVLNDEGRAEVRATNVTFPYQYEFTWQLAVQTSGQIGGTVLLVRSGNAGLVGGANIDGTIVSLTR